jgi:hypothetical protein
VAARGDVHGSVVYLGAPGEAPGTRWGSLDVDSPAEYVAKIEADLRAARARADDLERQLYEADLLRSSVVMAAAEDAKSALGMLERIALLQTIVDAAVAWRRAYDPGLPVKECVRQVHVRAVALRDLLDQYLRGIS